MIHSEHRIVFSVALDGQVSGGVALECHDPLIVRADAVVVDRVGRAISAIVDGVHAELGSLSDDLLRLLTGQEKMLISARHFAGHQVSRHVPVITH